MTPADGAPATLPFSREPLASAGVALARGSRLNHLVRLSIHMEDDWLLTSARAAVHRPTATAVLSDLHLGYAEARRRSGEAIPAVDLNSVLAPLASVLAPLRVRRLVIAGALFEAGFNEAR